MRFFFKKSTKQCGIMFFVVLAAEGLDLLSYPRDGEEVLDTLPPGCVIEVGWDGVSGPPGRTKTNCASNGHPPREDRARVGFPRPGRGSIGASGRRV